jgi:hypothetical protein
MGRDRVQAVASYIEPKTVWIELTGATRDPFQLGCARAPGRRVVDT